MTSLLDVIAEEAIDRQRRGEAIARGTCDYCGKPFRYRYFYVGDGDGWRGQYVTVSINGRYYIICGKRCCKRLWGYLGRGLGRVPRLIGRETVEEVMKLNKERTTV